MRRPDALIPCKPGAEDIPAMNGRAAWMDALYLHDGRHKKDHPCHGIYTGLAMKYRGLGFADISDND
jgi:hypothetical protein